MFLCPQPALSVRPAGRNQFLARRKAVEPSQGILPRPLGVDGAVGRDFGTEWGALSEFCEKSRREPVLLQDELFFSDGAAEGPKLAPQREILPVAVDDQPGLFEAQHAFGVEEFGIHVHGDDP